MLLSLISPQKNVAFFAPEFKKNISWISKYVDSVELIVVEDNSTDSSWVTLNELFQGFENVRIVRNKGLGKIEALNFGFSLCNGEYVRFIDGDDFILEDTLTTVETIKQLDGDALSSSFKIKIDNQFHPVVSKFFRMSVFDKEKFHSPPRWNWTLKTELARKFFPIPTELPFEDLYMAVNILYKARKIVAIPWVDYIYRQHSAQTYGGIHKSSHKLLMYRADRNLRVLEYLDSHFDLRPGIKKLLEDQRKILSGKNSFKKFFLVRPVLFALVFKAKLCLELVAYKLYKKQTPKVYLNDYY